MNANRVELRTAAWGERQTRTGAFPDVVMAKRAGKPADPDLMRVLCGIIPAGASVVDLGAGEGRHVRALREAGYQAVGFDGAANCEEVSGGCVRVKDLTKPVYWDEVMYDAAICVEVGEHIPPEKMAAFLGNFLWLHAKLLIVSWAVPGQRGRGHVSCHLPEWVVEKLLVRAWPFDEQKTLRARELAGRSGWREKVLVFNRASETR